DEAAARFKEIQEAYAVLSDSSKRASYDQFGHAAFSGGAGGAGGFGGFDFQDVGDIFGDIFGNIFGEGGRGGTRQQRGQDLGYDLQIMLEEAIHGVEKEIKIPTWASCKTCKGEGSKKGSKPENCSTCQGTGQVRMQHGFIAMQQTCSACRGQGKVIKDPCKDCSGQGRVRERRTLSVQVPAGVDNGDRIRLNGEGEAGANGAPAGDLYVQMHVKEHSIFTREGNDLHCVVPVSFVTATLGGEIQVPTISDEVTLKIPAETQTGKVFRLRGKGVKALRGGGTGDLLCHIAIETPVSLTSEQKEHLQQFEEMLERDGDKHKPQSKSWFDNVKKFFRKK
nr:molecular chaperone DnaJ [Gammaproteobacteria bacterium]